MKRTIQNKEGKQITTISLSDLGPLTEDEKKMILKAKERPVVYDDDCPPIPDALLDVMLYKANKRVAV